MTTDLIVPDQLSVWVPGDLTVHSPDTGWDGVSVCGYRHAGSDVGAARLRRSVRLLRPEPHDPRRQPARRGHSRHIPRGLTTGTRRRS